MLNHLLIFIITKISIEVHLECIRYRPVSKLVAVIITYISIVRQTKLIKRFVITCLLFLYYSPLVANVFDYKRSEFFLDFKTR